MKSTGVVRRTDLLGRIVIPVEVRRVLDINVKDSMEIFIEGENIILRKYAPGCGACGSMNIVAEVGTVKLCKDCASSIMAAQRGG
jgi:transcriptional pleiotropic regulator of transition state genes